MRMLAVSETRKQDDLGGTREHFQEHALWQLLLNGRSLFKSHMFQELDELLYAATFLERRIG